MKLAVQNHSISMPYAALKPSCGSPRIGGATTLNVEKHTRNLRTSSLPLTLITWRSNSKSSVVSVPRFTSVSAAIQPLDLTEDNVKQVLSDCRDEFGQIFDVSMGMTGVVELVELDGPFVKISLKGRFWHERSLVLARIGNYLKQRIPEILEVEIEDEKQLDDSPENF